MSNKSLREVCTETGVTRRAVQGYEKAGLVSAAGKNKYGYLLYDEAGVARIKTIKVTQTKITQLKITEMPTAWKMKFWSYLRAIFCHGKLPARIDAYLIASFLLNPINYLTRPYFAENTAGAKKEKHRKQNRYRNRIRSELRRQTV